MERLTGSRFKKALIAGITWFSHYRRQVDDINVFPVADGDTGKNMHHAFIAAQKAIEAVQSNKASEIAWAAARGALMGGRGCSGMILSGFFSGFAEGVGDRHTLTSGDLAKALQIGSLRARERVEHPKEGTMLTVGEAAARQAAEGARASSNVFETIQAAWQGAAQALAQTSDLLPVLKEHRVVDAGGQGLVYFFEGLVRYSRRQPVDALAARIDPAPAPKPTAQAPITLYKFCTEFILESTTATEAVLRRELAPWGEHLMVAGAPGGVFKIHVHTQDPEPVFKLVSGWGTVTWRKVDNMAEQHRHAFGPAEG